MLQLTLEKLEKWIKIVDDDLHCFDNKHDVMNRIKVIKEQITIVELSYRNIEVGVLAFMVMPDFTGDLCLNELLLYLKPKHRNFRVFSRVMKCIEECAKQLNCTKILIGGNIGYRDDDFLRILSRYGYKPDTVSKSIIRG